MQKPIDAIAYMSLPHLIMGVLSYEAVSGYDLNKAFQASVQHFWNTEQSQIYRALHKLRDAGWVVIEEVAQDNAPDKKIYHLTEAGRAELQRWIGTAQPLSSLHEGWLGQLFFGAEVDTAVLEQLLADRLANLRQLITVYETEVAVGAMQYAEKYAAPEAMRFWMLTLDCGIQRARFDIRWIEETALPFLREMKTNKP
jgi:PadR family transcriptional regulator AphA